MQEINGYFTYQNFNMNERVAQLREYHQAHELLHTYMAIPLFREWLHITGAKNPKRGDEEGMGRES